MKFREGKIIDKFVAGKDIEVVLRYPKAGDAKQLMQFYNKVTSETGFLSRTSHVKIKEQKKWVAEIMKKSKKNDAVLVLAESGGKIIGNSSITRRPDEIHRHIGVFGIAILQEYTGKGIGYKLTKLLLEMSRPMKIDIVQSCCHAGNKPSLGLHKKFGFRIAGKFPKGIKRSNKYSDQILLYKILVSKQ